MAENRGMVVRVSRSELFTGKLDRPMGKEDLDVFRTHLAGSNCAEDETLARDAVLMWRAGRALAEERERRFLDALFAESEVR